MRALQDIVSHLIQQKSLNEAKGKVDTNIKQDFEEGNQHISSNVPNEAALTPYVQNKEKKANQKDNYSKLTRVNPTEGVRSSSKQSSAAHATANRSRLTIFYNPRNVSKACPLEFVIPLAKYRKPVYSTQLSVGMRFGMMFETEEIGKGRAYDRAATKFRRLHANINFNFDYYHDDLKQDILLTLPHGIKLVSLEIADICLYFVVSLTQTQIIRSDSKITKVSLLCHASQINPSNLDIFISSQICLFHMLTLSCIVQLKKLEANFEIFLTCFDMNLT
ncbi:hypothetical protein CQW23_33653 [Capsicum baccatum]|uniref:Uncharacterized protein n=1 Tax=Capsicum baccatum TaxID=33114 RepID=A0A2G2V185_CAPBA|nr:hypothetical protein CQW23_33653 [Capsicum baccatum]